MSASDEIPESVINRFTAVKTVRLVDTDATGMVHLSALIRMMEECEYEFLRSRDLSVVLRDGRGLMGFPRLSTSIEVLNSVGFDETLQIELHLVNVDGKTIEYHFVATAQEGSIVAKARFLVAVCRFPPDDAPYAILTPEFVVEALTKPGAVLQRQ